MILILKVFLLLIIPFINIQGQQSTKTLKEIKRFGDNPGNLKMYVHNNIPKDTRKLPLVIVMHGCSQNAKNVADLTGWNKLADIHQFVVLYPQQKRINNPNLCFNWFVNHDNEKGQGECESVYQMISFALNNYPIDRNNIFITGLSAGAAMSVVMTATHPELFKSGAIFAGDAYRVAENPKEGVKVLFDKIQIPREKLVESVRSQNLNYNGHYPSLIIYQGANDPIVKPQSAERLVAQWTGLHQTDTIADKVEKSFLGFDDISRSEYLDSLGKISLIFYEVNHLGHRLLIKPGEKEDEGGKTGLFGVDKGFHSTYQTAKDFGILKND